MRTPAFRPAPRSRRQPGYGVVDFGDYPSVILLDSGHLNPAGGEQAAWLDDVLAQRARVPHVFPAYHVPAFPTFRPLTERCVRAVQDNWVPHFEKHNLAVVFENHDHNFKRTHPIRDGRRDSDGVTYLGDGAWGVFVVGIARDERRFLEKAMPINQLLSRAAQWRARRSLPSTSRTSRSINSSRGPVGSRPAAEALFAG